MRKKMRENKIMILNRKLSNNKIYNIFSNNRLYITLFAIQEYTMQEYEQDCNYSAQQHLLNFLFPINY